MRAIVVGGGMGGLSAAAALHKSGRFVRIDVFEQAASATAVGAGINVTPNGARVCRDLGIDLASDVAKAIRLPGARSVKRDNSVVSGTLDQKGYGDGAGFHHLHRADLLAAMHARARELAPVVRVHMGARLVALTQDAGLVTAEFASRSGGVSTRSAEVLVGADGIHSKVLSELWPEAPPLRWTEVTGFRGIARKERVAGLQMDNPAAGSMTMDMRVVPKSVCLTYWIQRGELLNIYVSVHEEKSTPYEGSEGDHWPVSHAEIRRRVSAAFEGDARRHDVLQLISVMESPSQWGLWDRDALEHWHKGRVVLLGDAAHPMLPAMGQGVNQALEDAAALGKCFERWGSDVGRALLHYERVRHHRALRFQVGSRFVFKHLIPPESEARSKMLSALNERDAAAFNLVQRPGTDDSWIYAHDARNIGDTLPLRKLGPWDYRSRRTAASLGGDVALWRPRKPPRRRPDGVTRAEVARHCTPGDAWVVIAGMAYDVTEWSDHHPGGSFLARLYAGKDVTAEFGDFHSAAARGHMRHFLVGPVADPRL